MTDTFLERFEQQRAAREQADRTFTLAGKKLTYRPAVAPEVGWKLEEMRITLIAQRQATQEYLKKLEAEPQENGDGPIDAGEIPEMMSDADMLFVADDTVLSCLEPGSHADWAWLRGGENPHPLTFSEIFEICDFLLGAVAGIPTVAPADSSAGRTATAKKSKAASSSPAKTPAGSR